jgi:hypothetical protein
MAIVLLQGLGTIGKRVVVRGSHIDANDALAPSRSPSAGIVDNLETALKFPLIAATLTCA